MRYMCGEETKASPKSIATINMVVFKGAKASRLTSVLMIRGVSYAANNEKLFLLRDYGLWEIET